MFIKSGLFLMLLTTLQVSARYKAVLPNNIESEIKPDSDAVSSTSSRISSGWEAKPGQFPYHAALRTANPQGSLWRCGGAILSKEWVVTSGQCTRDLGSVIVRVGLLFHSPDAFYPGKEWYRPPGYNDLQWNNQPNDISLVKTQRPIVYTDFVKPIRVQSSADAYRDYDGERLYFSGHGRLGPFGIGAIPNELRWVYLQAVSNTECARTFPNGLVVNTTICARYYNDTTQSPCHGDGGGPLASVGSDGVPTLIGVWSFMRGEDACESGLPTGFTRPGPYLPWFEEVTGIDFENLQEDATASTTSSTAAPTTATASTTTTTTITTPTTTPTTINPAPTTTTVTTPSTTTFTIPTTITIPTTTELTNTTESEDVTAPPEDSGEGGDSDSSESDEDDDMAQLLKRLLVLVKVKVRMDKYNATHAVNHHKH